MKIEDEFEGHKFHWNVYIKPSSRPISTEYKTCSFCGGGCVPHFGMIDDPVSCSMCGNTGKQLVEKQWTPPIPKELEDGIKKVLREYWNKQQNDKFVLTGE